jgi:hypothetical protein
VLQVGERPEGHFPAAPGGGGLVEDLRQPQDFRRLAQIGQAGRSAQADEAVLSGIGEQLFL